MAKPALDAQASESRKRKAAGGDDSRPNDKIKKQKKQKEKRHVSGRDAVTDPAANGSGIIAQAALNDDLTPPTAPESDMPESSNIIEERRIKKLKKAKKAKSASKDGDWTAGPESPSQPRFDGTNPTQKAAAPEIGDGSGELTVSPVPKKKKKKKTKTGIAGEEALESACNEHTTRVTDVAPLMDTGDVAANGDGAVDSKAQRFIAFIGNLPYNTTTASLERHFASIRPDGIRHLTEKDKDGKAKAKGKEPKSKGYAFLEFNSYDRMLTCLKLYHHSLFTVDVDASERSKGSGTVDGVKPGKASGKEDGRRINVELTAGGGGKSQARREKLRLKNEKLGRERERRVLAEKTKKLEEGKAGAKTAPMPADDGEASMHDSGAAAAGNDRGGMHPSRMAMIESADIPQHEDTNFSQHRRGGFNSGRGARPRRGGRGGKRGSRGRW